MMTRAQLIGGMMATGALAACGGSSTNPSPKPSPSLCLPGSLSAADPNQIFSDPAFSNLDKAKLLALVDPSPQIQGNDAGYFKQSGQQVQTASVIRSIPAAGIVIRSPGRYTLGANVTWTPSASLTSAITIACSGVTLDFAGYTLTAAVPNIAWQTTGVLVGTAAGTAIENIAISNGTIASFTEYGIFANGVCGLSFANVAVTGVCMQNLDTRLLTPAGIYVAQSLDVTIAFCSVTQLKVMTDSCAGIFVHKSIGGTIKNCRTDTLVNLDGAVQGFSLIQCIDVTTTACRAQNLQSFFNGNTMTSGHTVLGFCPIFCWNLKYDDCSAIGLTGSCDDVHGMSVFLDGQVTVTRFNADTVVDGPKPYNTGAKATGLEVYGVVVTVTDSTVSNVTANNPQDLQAAGFSAWGLTIGFENCSATNVVATGAGAQGLGFGYAPDPRPIFDFPAIGVAYTNCAATDCAVGFDTFYHVNSIWLHPTCTNCATNVLIEPGVQRTFTCDGCSECASGGKLNPPGFSPTPPPGHYFETLTNVASGNLVVP